MEWLIQFFSWSAILRAVVCLPENITFLATRNRATMPSLGKIQEFNSSTSSISRYLERLEQYFVTNSVPADSAESHKRRAILISVIGAKAYDVVSDPCSPIPPSEKTYAQLTTILKNHFAPKKLVIAGRYRFHNCTRREGESVTASAANLKHLASTCQFGTHLNEALRDRLVCGLRSKEKRMLLRSRKKVQLLLTKSTLVIVEVFSLPNVVRVLASEASSIPLVVTLKTPRSVWAAEKQGTHVLSVNIEIPHVILAVKLVTSRRHAKGNLRKCTS